ncbi:Site-specific recombinase XerD [Tindallia magadiensis]|uniref:Site-specific recombinase XerD n=1 Tax=Tindallia magadiensis TaxID=69895 RepID=A0A1I3I0U8_9FIRM|nr:tyrosine-type recombinase/integrase [Tindallia magadiensis]SFI41469.1 Site-specific recombinase XerD [Tindallia magadiensis]
MSSSQSFLSTLAVPIEQYIAEKQATGYSFQKGVAMLKSFDAFLQEQQLSETILSKQTVLDWTARKPQETVSNQHCRISLLRGLAEYMNRIGLPAYVYPKASVTVQRYGYIPYLFSKKELKEIFRVCDQYPSSAVSPNRHLMLPLLMRLLYGCGLRLSEALRLKISDVDVEMGILFIRHAKFNKERRLPLTDSLTERCRDYYRQAQIGERNNPYFFPSPYGGRYSESTIYKLFRDILQQAGISHLGRGKGPRIHDFRHVFSVTCLKKWVAEGKDLQNALPYLSAYLGHEDLRGTQRYLRLTAELYPDILDCVEKSCAWIIPEVKEYETD